MLRLRVLALTLLLATAAQTTRAGLPPEGAPAVRLVSPARDAVAFEGGLRFAWTPNATGGRHYVLTSRSPFDATAWRSLEEAGEVRAHEVAHPVASFDALGIRVAGRAPLYWAAAHLDPPSGHWTFSETRRLDLIPKFANEVRQTPALEISPVMAAAPRADRGPDRIRLASGYEIDPAVGEPAIPADLRASSARATGRRALLVHYGDADPEAARARILAAGGTIAGYVPDRTFLVRVGATTIESAGALAAATEAAWVGEYQPAYKLSRRIEREGTAPVRATVLLFDDGDLDEVSTAALASGVRIERTSDNGVNKIIRIEATPTALLGLAHQPDVAWIEPYVAPVTDNDNSQWVCQTGINGNRRIWDMGIRGEGQVLMTSDSGINVGHNQFRDAGVSILSFGDYPTHRKIIAYKPGADDPNVTFGDHGSYHGTHTAGTAAGNDDPNAVSPRDGAAKNARLYFMDLSGPALGFSGLATFTDLNDLFTPPYEGNAAGAARISSNSWGSAVGGEYTIDSYAVDQFTWSHPDFLICFSNGNSGPAGQTVGAPATSKNSVSVGASQNGNSAGSMYTGSSRGPTEDGRRKPTLVAPGQSVYSSTTSTATYAAFTGTSMATPAVAGTAVLMRQYLTEGWYPTGAKVPANGFEPSAALLKAMLVNAAANVMTGFTAPDNNVGYGRLTADEVLYFAGDSKRLLVDDFTAGLGHQQAVEYQVNVVDIGVPLEISLCWMDYPGNPAAAKQIVNDLDLTVTKGATVYKGNVYAGGVSATGGTYDDTNVEEAVFVAGPTTGIYTIRVEGTNVPVGPQPFGLVVTGGIGTTAGTVAMDRAEYGSASMVELRVVDTNAAGPLNVVVTSDTEPAGETVMLAGGDGLFTGSLPLTPAEGSGGDGFLQVSHGDLLVATYQDASPVASLEAQAQVSFAPAVITGVAATDAGSGTVRVTWETDRNASSLVEYGLTTALGDSASEGDAVFSHAVMIDGLEYGETYYYDVVSTDLNGSMTRDDNGGMHYRFTAGEPGDLLLVYGGPGFEREDRYENALKNLGWSYDVWRGTQSESPLVGNLDAGLRSYNVVWWQPGLEGQYPAFTDAARDSITAYLDGGGRMTVTGHDIVWGMADPSSPGYSIARKAWVENTLHTMFQSDPPGWTSLTGIADDPISGAYLGGVPYAQHRAGASGDLVDGLSGSGSFAYVWRGPTDDAAIRWESGGPLGDPGDALWGGSTTRYVGQYFEWTSIDPTLDDSAIRDDVMEKTLEWLIGRARPTVDVTSPNGGETLVGDSEPISWNESTAGGMSVGSRTIEYSIDGGGSWTLITDSPGASPYLWDLTGVPNTLSALVRVTVTDDGMPGLSRLDVSDATFVIDRAGGDGVGPAVVPGSIASAPNPVTAGSPATVTASVSDLNSGGGDVDAAEWSFGTSPAPAGSGQAMTGGFPATTVAVSAALSTGSFGPGPGAIWVRGRDADGNWGEARALEIVVNGVSVGTGDAPSRYELMAPAPNPSFAVTRIGFALPLRGPVDLSVFDVQGRKVRTLFSGVAPAGVHDARWDRTDASGRTVEPGVYFVRLRAGGQEFQRRIVALY